MKTSLQVTLAVLLALAASLAKAQDAPPASDIWLLPMAAIDQPGEGQQPLNISAHPGYDNQPAFDPDSAGVYYTRFDDGQTDIWYWRRDSGVQRRVTETPESEYSPTPVPDTAALSMVRVEGDGKQRLWQFSLEDQAMTLLVPDMEPVGYHSWYSPRALALFMLPEPFRLVLWAGSNEQLPVAEQIGRALARDPVSGRLLYVDKSETPWMLRAFEPGMEEGDGLVPMFPEVEDFAVGPDGVVWSGNGRRLYRLPPGSDRWELAIDLNEFGIDGITRLAISPDGQWLALVAEETPSEAAEAEQ